MQHPTTRANGQRGSFKKNGSFKTPAYNPMNFNANQMPDNPGYMDFNDPTPVVQNLPVKNVAKTQQQVPAQQQKQQQQQQQGQLQQKPNSQLKKSQGSRNNKTKKQMPNNGQGNNRNWQPNKFNGPPIERFGFKPPMGAPRGRPLPIGGPRVRQPLPPVAHGFPPRPHVRPPMMPMGGHGGMPPPPPLPLAAQQLPPPPFLRRSARGLPPRPPMPPMMPPPVRMGRGVPPIPFGNGDIGKNRKINGKAVKKVIKSKSTIKTLKNIVNQYPLDKPWVTDEIRNENEKKVDIENRLKGNKNDELFAQFKVQRDKFVHLYEQAREEYTKQQQQQQQQSNKKNDANNKEKVNQTTELDENILNQD